MTETTNKRLVAQAINRYLAALNNGSLPKVVTEEEREFKVQVLNEKIDTATKKGQWLRVLDLTEAIYQLSVAEPVKDFEGEFIPVAKEYGERHEVSYFAWRQLGVPARVLKSAGIGRSKNG